VRSALSALLIVRQSNPPGQATQPTGALHVPTPSTIASSSRGHVVRDEVWYREAADPETYSLINRGMEDMLEHGLEDPVAQGILGAAQAEAAFQL
jgi:hypothetical protein